MEVLFGIWPEIYGNTLTRQIPLMGLVLLRGNYLSRAVALHLAGRNGRAVQTRAQGPLMLLMALPKEWEESGIVTGPPIMYFFEEEIGSMELP